MEERITSVVTNWKSKGGNVSIHVHEGSHFHHSLEEVGGAGEVRQFRISGYRGKFVFQKETPSVDHDGGDAVDIRAVYLPN